MKKFVAIPLMFVIAILLSVNIFASEVVDPVVGGKYHIRCYGTNKYLNVDGNSSSLPASLSIYPLDVRYPSGQTFTVLYGSNGYMFKPDCNSGVVNVFNYSANNFDVVNIYKKSGSKTQSWYPIRVAKGHYYLASEDGRDLYLNAIKNENRAGINIVSENYINFGIWVFETLGSDV